MTIVDHRTARTLSAALGIATLAGALGAQPTDARRAPATVRVQVADSLGVPVADAEVTLMRGLRTVVATARTDASGHHEFIVDLDSTEYSVVARRIGYTRGDRFFSVGRGDVTVPVTMHMSRTVIPGVTILADDARHESYYIDADQIAASAIELHDGLDIVERLRPDMIISRSGAWGGRARYGCASMTHVWVNGRRYDNGFTIVSPAASIRAKGIGNRAARMGTGNMTTLMEIAPEHVAEMYYRDCFDTNERRYGSTDALFIVLKPGVAYRPGWGTFVVNADDEAKARDKAKDKARDKAKGKAKGAAR